MANILQTKIAGMSDQQAEKLSREVCEFIEMFDDPTAYPAAFPLLRWLYKAITLEGAVAEQIHLCDACRRNNHKRHSIGYKDVDGKYWMCRCPQCPEAVEKARQDRS